MATLHPTLRRRAGRLYTLAVVAHLDTMGAKNDEEESVMANAISRSRLDLRRLGYNYLNLQTAGDCLEAAKAWKPNEGR